MAILELKNIKRTYKTKCVVTEVLKGIDFSVEAGEFVAIMGESGAGKTTLLNVIATFDKPTSGSVILNGKEISTLKNSEISTFRRNKLGFVFQDFNLLDQFNNRDNIYLPLVLSNQKPQLMQERLDQIKDQLGISELLNKYPYEISGGQKQRVAIARAIITKPDLVLADEPTGSLDSTSSEIILNMFAKINQAGQTIMMVTHSLRAASFAKRILFIKDGIVYHEIYRSQAESQSEFMERISQAQFMLKRGEQ
ncbi:ABC transporter ATP-binding protein [Lactobacillus iners]|jgi:ABC superfamily ATP binding cassette transporter, ABC protein|uniref:ABC transporter ATP-binding protein n=3 Tax=Lactobacillus iners TaxID=147802 RepID=A0A6G7B6L3_9LACO|nr:ABC transporter ATP-binding protein [Lactobacillus iners]EFO66900.1 putative bacteriocin export ABC transporter, lactococcin 972 group [Lactobacillus iners LactinV 11V1-d]EFO67241.1 putative bacteriocin export ABC transporter, lactococcin 972 group [Lactobacillus iners LactinV 09V1-c]EFO69459.1 putative bacteriocin export ABC transporter, lactococcin 972 group [Lactobacillus iners LactinV 03V1-b]EFO70755.1 putative bacteriocin export ABC transporter, lactococcin 972 group [Lactobacillus iner